MRRGDYVKFDDDSLTFTCAEDGDGSNHTYPRSTDPVSGKWLRIRNVTTDTFKVRVLDFIPSTNTTTHTFVSATSNGLKQKKDQAYDQAIDIVDSSIDRISINVGIAATNASTHVYSSSLSNAITVGGNYVHTFLSATTGAVKHGYGVREACTPQQANIDTLMDLAYTALSQGNFSGITRTVGNHGDGYETAPTVVITGGSPTTAGTYVPQLAARGYVKSIGIITGGVGYNNVPTVRITSNTGFNASGTATVSGGAVTGITVDQGGFGYNDVTVEIIANAADTITTTARAAAIVGRHLEGIVVQETGAGYQSTPTLSLTGGSPSTTAGSQSVARTTGAVTGVTLVSGGDNYKNTDILGVDPADVGGTVGNSFQVGVETVTFNGTTTAFPATVGGSGYTLPANDRFLLFLNSHIQELGSSYSYSGTPSTINFTEAPKGNMDFYCFYVGQLQDMDSIAPFMNGTKKTFILKKNDQPFSLESDSTEVIPANNLVMFLNGVYQEPEVSYTLDGSILTSVRHQGNSEVLIYIYTGSDLDIVTEDTYSALDPGDLLQVQSEGDIRRLATIASSSSLDTYEYTGLRPNVAIFSATVVNGVVVQVNIVDSGSNYEVAPFLIFSGGGGSGAFAETIIEQGSGKVIGIKNLQGGSNYNTPPAVTIPSNRFREDTEEQELSLTVCSYTVHS